MIEKYTEKSEKSVVSELKYLGTKLNSKCKNYIDIRGNVTKELGQWLKYKKNPSNYVFLPIQFQSRENNERKYVPGVNFKQFGSFIQPYDDWYSKLKQCHEMAIRKLFEVPS